MPKPTKPNLKDRTKSVIQVLERLSPIPDEWVGERQGKEDQTELQPLPCDNYKRLQIAWRKALRWTEGLDCALSVMLSSVISTKSVGDQLWVKIIGPPSCGKSTLCEAISVARQYVYAKSTIRGFYSGYKSQDGQDNSLINQIMNKTLVIKDGDTLLQSPNLGKILSEARDIYDRVGRAHYLNKISNDYTGINMTLILSGTSSLRGIDNSELGERFLDCVVMDTIDDELEDEILVRVVHRASRNLGQESDGKAETQYDEELALAMRLTGGYVKHLRENATSLLQDIYAGEEELKRCIHLGKFVAYMRARPSKVQQESAEREFAARLVSQHIRLAKCLAAVLNKKKLDVEVMRRTTKIALDTCRGQTLQIAKELFPQGREGMELKSIAMLTSYTESETRRMLRFLSRIGVVERFAVKSKRGVRSKTYWRLTTRLYRLYRTVVPLDDQ